jgi:hypothetical protein
MRMMELRCKIVGTKWLGENAIAALAFVDPLHVITLKAEFDNPKDPNAIGVYASVYGGLVQVGYLPMARNAPVADAFRRGIAVTAKVVAEGIVSNGDVKFMPEILVTWES